MTNYDYLSSLHGDSDSYSAILATSMSADDANTRWKAYESVFSNQDEFANTFKTGYNLMDSMYADAAPGSPGLSSTGPAPGTNFFDATVSANIRSWAGLFCIERPMTQPKAMLPFFNTFGVDTGTLLTPNIGVSRTYDESKAGRRHEFTATAAQTAFTLTVDKSIVPTSVSIEVKGTDTANQFSAADDGKGNITAPPAKLASAVMRYKKSGNDEPTITITLAAGLSANDKVVFNYILDTPEQMNEKLKGEVEYYQSIAHPIIIPYELNQVSQMTAQKSLGMDMRKHMMTSITDEYTKVINKSCTENLKLSSDGAKFQIELSAYTIATSDYRTYMEAFIGQLKELDTQMAKQTEKGTRISAFLVGLNISDLFNKLDGFTNKWVPNNNLTYIDDVLGYFNGVPVVRSKWLGDNQGFGIHKTKDGALAPLMRGMFLPLTTMNEVGDFGNPLLSSGGIFSYESMSALTKDLTIEFTVSLPTSFGITAL